MFYMVRGVVCLVLRQLSHADFVAVLQAGVSDYSQQSAALRMLGDLARPSFKRYNRRRGSAVCVWD